MFNLNSDFAVFIGTSPNDIFRLNVSLLDGSDVLANDVLPLIEYVDFAHLCTEVQFENGVSAVGTSIDLGSKTGTIVLAAQGVDPLDGYFVKVNSPVQLTLKNYPVGGMDYPWAAGFIKSIERDTDATGLTRVVIRFGDQVEQLMNLNATISVATDQSFDERWWSIYDDAVNGTNIPLVVTGVSSGFTFPGIDIFEVPLAETINETMQGELGWLVTGNNDGIYPMSHTHLQNLLVSTPFAEFHQDVTDHHIPPTYINLASSSDSIISTINASLTWDPLTTFSLTDTDNADLYGDSVLDISVNLADEGNLSNFAYYALSLTGQQKIKSLSVDAFDHRNSKLHPVYQMQPADCVLVNVQANGINVNENYLISKIIHSITPDTWQTDLELWRN